MCNVCARACAPEHLCDELGNIIVCMLMHVCTMNTRNSHCMQYNMNVCSCVYVCVCVCRLKPLLLYPSKQMNESYQRIFMPISLSCSNTYCQVSMSRLNNVHQYTYLFPLFPPRGGRYECGGAKRTECVLTESKIE